MGFCATHNITLTPPNCYDINSFSWNSYIEETDSKIAGEHLFHRIVPDHGFEVTLTLFRIHKQKFNNDC